MFRVARRVPVVVMLLAGVPTLTSCADRLPLNPPQLVGSQETDMAIQLFMQATILMARYYGFETLSYETVRTKSEKAGYRALPFMPPVSIPATPPFRRETLQSGIPLYQGDRSDFEIQRFQAWVNGSFGYNNLVKYYISTGLHASQIICRNHLQGLEERNRYLE